MKIGVTGTRGVLGRRIAGALATHHDQVVPYPGDVRDRDALFQWAAGLDALVHAAAVVPLTVVHRDIPAAVAVNVLGTALVATAAAHTSTGHITYISTSHVYQGSRAPVSEDHCLQPASPYGLSKWQGEQWVQNITDRHLIVRVFSYFASNQQESFLVPSLAKRVVNAPPNAVLELNNPRALRDIADADWMAAICARLIHDQEKGVINCGTGNGYSVLEIADTLRECLGRSDCRWQSGTDHTDGLVADTSRLRARLTPFPAFSLPQALARFVQERSQ
ncbi:MAG: NAD(P)-dependent oxidoreductase [Magnetococcales bacterium]|nr:NAD(P)-dependent oxidoreductase [Magnetococcales bacterium]